MTSYSKQMMAVARTWLAANPDPDDAMLKIPGADMRRDEWLSTDRGSAVMRTIAESQHLVASRPGLSSRLAPLQREVTRLTTEREAAARELHETERVLEAMLNQGLLPQHRKHAVETQLHTDLGRWCVAWARHGYNVLDLSPDFTAAMLLTDARDLDIADVRMPFSGILVTLPDGFARGAEGSSYTKIHVVEVSRSMLNQLEISDEVMTTLEALPRESVLRVVGKIDREIRTAGGVLPPKSLLGAPVVCRVCEPELDTALQIYATDGVHVLDTFIERRGLTWDAFDALPDDVTDDADRQARHTIRRVVFGALAYLSAVPTALARRESQSRKKHREPGEAPTTWDVGRTVKIDPQLVRSVRAGAREVALRLRCRHIVRGHYRDQPHGPRRSERKRIWLKPFWRGPQDGAELVHTYRLERGGRT